MNKRFITGQASVKQNTNTGKWYTEHNQLFLDFDGLIYLVPKNEDTDGYSYPSGGRMAQWDIRPAIGHDFECKYHQKILVKLSLAQLMNMGYLKNKESFLVCKNIPIEFLEIKNTTFIETNLRFKRMMLSCSISKAWLNTMFLAVHLNVNWLKTGKTKFDINNIYKISI